MLLSSSTANRNSKAEHRQRIRSHQRAPPQCRDARGRLLKRQGRSPAVSALLSGESLDGTWYNRSLEHAARVRADKADPERFAEQEVLSLVPLPCWKDLSPEAYRARIAGLVEKIEADAAALREQTGREPLGARAILRQDPKTEPNWTKKSPAPRFHAFSQRVRRELYEAYALFVSAFRIVADKLKAGDRKASFPTGSFPPHLPFVRGLTAESLAPG